MSPRWVWLGVLLAVGCRGVPHRLHKNAPCAPPPPAGEVECAPEGPGACAAEGRERVGPDIHVEVPRQRVVVPRRAAAGVAQSAGPGSTTQTTEQQQILQTRQVMLVPQQVLVPFVQTTTTGPVRVAGLQETQVFNAATANLAQAGGVNVASNTLAVTQNAASLQALAAGAGLQAAGAAQGAANAPAANAAANPNAARPADAQASECAAQLRSAEARIQQLTVVAERLAVQVDRLQAAQVAPAPPAVPSAQPAQSFRPVTPAQPTPAPAH